MKFTIILGLFLFQLSQHQLNAQTDNSRLSANLMQLLHSEEVRSKTGQSDGAAQSGSSASVLSLLIKVNGSVDELGMIQSGAVVGTKAGNIWTVRVPRENLKTFTGLKGIAYMELAQKVGLQMDSARYFTHVDSAMQGIGIPMPLSGKGVIVGIVDIGFDYTNPAFYDTSYSKLRIAKAWVQGMTGTPPAGYSYGAEFKDTLAILQKKYDLDDAGSHGNGCASIAAGSGTGSKKARAGRGMAYESELVFVSLPQTVQEWREVNMATIIDGINYVFSYAQSQGKPAVVNVSMGSVVGAKDGGSLFAQACDQLAGSGRILVFPAMNNGSTKCHIGKSFSALDTALKTLVPMDKFFTGERRNYMDVWGDSFQSFCLEFGMYSGGAIINKSAVYCMDNSTKDIFIIGSDNDTCFITLTTKQQDYNKKPHATIDIFSKSADTLCLGVYANSGAVHMWQEYFDESWVTIWGKFLGNKSWATEGDDQYTIGEMGCTKSAITAGATVSRVFWKNLLGQTYYIPGNNNQGALAYYSSRGPTLDNRMKPDITAPGGMIYYAANSYDPTNLPGGIYVPYLVAKYTSPKNSRNYYYTAGMGTSFASPMVAGTVALLLQVNPDLNYDRVKDILYKTATKDNYTTTTPDQAKWGAGKLNAYAAVKEAIRTIGTVEIPQMESEINVFPNPGSGIFTLEFQSGNSGYYFVEVSTISGRIIQSDAWQLSEGKNLHELDLRKYEKGIYFVEITGHGGQIVKKVILE